MYTIKPGEPPSNLPAKKTTFQSGSNGFRGPEPNPSGLRPPPPAPNSFKPPPPSLPGKNPKSRLAAILAGKFGAKGKAQAFFMKNVIK